MFFYLIQNSSLIEKELDNKDKFIKVLIYGSISYIILHGTLFIGGENSLLYDLKIYFWMFLILDCTTIYLLNKNNFNNIIQKYIESNKQNNKKNIKQVKKKNVRFENIKYDSDSDSDSDINTDLDSDLQQFKNSLDFN